MPWGVIMTCRQKGSGTHFIAPACDIAPKPIYQIIRGCWYRPGNFLQQLLYHGDMAPSVNSWAIFDAPTLCFGDVALRLVLIVIIAYLLVILHGQDAHKKWSFSFEGSCFDDWVGDHNEWTSYCWWDNLQDFIMMTSSNRNIFGFTGPLCGEFTGHQWIPHTKASDAEL